MFPRILPGVLLFPMLAVWLPADPPRPDADGFSLPEHALFRLGSLKLRHSWLVGAVAFSGDGKQVVSVGVDLETHVWEADSGKETLFRKHDESRQGTLRGPGLVLARDGSLLAVASGETCTLSDPRTGKSLHTLNGHKSRIEGVAFSNDGKLLATAAIDRTACVWDTATGKLLHTFEHDGGSSGVCVALSPDGRTLAYGDGWGLELWHLGKGSTSGPKLGRKPDEFVTDLAFSPDGKTLAAVHDRNAPTLCLWDVATGNLLKQTPLPNQKAGYLGHAPDGSRYRIDATEQERVVRSIFTGEVLCRLASARADLRILAFSPDGKLLAAGDGISVRLWDTATGKELHQAESEVASNPLTEVRYTADGRTIVGNGLSSSALSLWDAQTGKSLPGFSWKSTANLDEATLILATPKEDGTVEVRDMRADKVLFQQKYPPGAARELTLRTVGRSAERTVLVLTYSPPVPPVPPVWDLHLWNLETKQQTVLRTPQELDNDQKPLAGSMRWQMAPDGKTLVTGLGPPRFPGFGGPAGPVLSETILRFWDIESGKLKSTHRFPGSAQGWDHSGFILGGKYYRVVGETTRMLPTGEKIEELTSYWWDMEQGKKVPGSDRTSDYFNFGATVSPDGKLEALTRPGIENLQSIFLRDVETGKIVQTLRLPTGTHHRVEFSPDGKILAAGGASDVHLFAVGSGELLGTLTGHRGTVRGLSFAPDGTRLATCATDTTTLVWDVTPFRKKLAPE
jgi:WD40 repeat protein